MRAKSTLYALRDLIRVLSLNPIDGKLIMSFPEARPGKLAECELQYLSLNPAVQINRMLDQVHKMVLASGTLEPAGDFALLKSSEDKGVDEQTARWKFSCGHVVPDENF